MKIYKVYMDLSLVMPRLKGFDLGEYSSNFPTIFVEARDPDEACHLSYYKLVEIMLKQDGSPATSALAKEILLYIAIRKIEVPQ
jgi:hypothetical protein